MSSSDEDWFNQDEDELVHDLEKKVKSLEVNQNEEHIDCIPEGKSDEKPTHPSNYI